MPVALVRNLHKGPTVFTDKNSDTAIEWAGAGDTDGEDLQQVPAEVLTNVNFLKMVRRGIFVVEEADGEAEEAWKQAQASFAARTSALPDVMDRSEAEPIVVVAEGDLLDGKITEKPLQVSVSREPLPDGASA